MKKHFLKIILTNFCSPRRERESSWVWEQQQEEREKEEEDGKRGGKGGREREGVGGREVFHPLLQDSV